MNINNPLEIEQSVCWKGLYKEAKKEKDAGNPKYTHLTSDCSICFSDYLPSEPMIMLPCSHGWHARCFSSWGKQICPLDRTSTEGSKVIFLGNELLLFRKYGDLESPQDQENLKHQARNWLKAQIEKDPTILELPERLQNNAKLAIGFLQNFLSMFERTLIQPVIIRAAKEDAQLLLRYLSFETGSKIGKRKLDDISSLCISFFTPFLPQNIESYHEHFALISIELAFYHFTDWDLNLRFNLEPHLREISDSQLFDVMALDPRQKERIYLYFSTMARDLIEPLRQLKIEEDRIFFKNHFQLLRALPSDKEKKVYLEKLDKTSFNHMKRLAQGKGPTSLSVQRLAKQIEGKIYRAISLLTICGLILIFSPRLHEEVIKEFASFYE
jgi:hypothetical protein